MTNYTNQQFMERVLDYIEDHLYDEYLDLHHISLHFGYSKYHLHRLFSAATHFPLHTYIQRRRLSEAGKLLVKTEQNIIDIALQSGYQSQRAFSKAFKKLYHVSPYAYRRKQMHYPMMMKYELSDTYSPISKTGIFDVRIEDKEESLFIGLKANTSLGFFVMGRCWKQLHKYKDSIQNRIDHDFLVGINDYSIFDKDKEQPSFDYYAVAEVDAFNDVPPKMTTKCLPASKYVVFSLKGHCEESMENIVEYIYGEWFLHSTLQFNEYCMYDFVKYGEKIDDQGESLIEYWIPINDS